MFEFGVIGLGPASCLFLACLPEDRLTRVVAFEPGCIGGDLARRYGGVVANLTSEQLCRALRNVPRWSTAPMPVLEAYAPDVCPTLADLCLQLRELMKPLLDRITLHSQHIDEIRQTMGGWIVGGQVVAKVIVCTGGEPRRLNYPRPAIPLEIALDKVALTSYVQPAARVVVFGTAHSGTLVLRNLREIGCKGVGIYRGKAFRWSRPHDTECPCHLLGGGCHDSEGVKQESARIADAIVRGEWGALTPDLVELSDSEALVRAVLEAEYVVYAVGFQKREIRFLGLGGEVLKVQHDPVTAAIAPGVWGFGLAYPSVYEKPQGGVAPDVGFPGFVGHIRACMDAIL